MRKFVVFICFILFSLASRAVYGHAVLEVRTDEDTAGTIVLTGRITDPTGESIIGANIMVKGTSVGTISDADGHFSLAGVKRGLYS